MTVRQDKNHPEFGDLRLMSNRNYVAVYGSLMKGFHFHGVMENAGGVFKCNAISRFNVRFNGRSFPYINFDDNGHKVFVEIYEVTKKGVEQMLDRLEGHPSFYERQQKEFVCDNGETITAWIYEYKSNIDSDNKYLKDINGEQVFKWYR